MSKEFTKKIGTGKLFIVATPIGNLEDVTVRALRILKEVDLIAAEDTRSSKILLSHYDIKTPLTSFFSAKQSAKAPALIEKLLNGKNVALITEAGTPGISDPGNYLVSAARANGIEIFPIPGPAAITAAVSVSGMHSHTFTFLGFLAPKGSKRNKALRLMAELKNPIVIYESPHRIKRTLRDLLSVLGNRKIFIAREMTKIYEEYFETDLQEAALLYEKTKPRGEFTIIVYENIEGPAPSEEG